MKRSERFYVRARRTLLWAMAILSAVFAGCVWSVRVMQETPSGGVACFFISLAGLFLFTGLLREALRLARLARNEERWEYRREVRPRL
jgi:hypothetical protein